MQVVSMDDHMVHRGHGVFDTALLVESYLYQLDQHLERWVENWKVLMLSGGLYVYLAFSTRGSMPCWPCPSWARQQLERWVGRETYSGTLGALQKHGGVAVGPDLAPANLRSRLAPQCRFLGSARKANVPLPMSPEQMRRIILETTAASCKINGGWWQAAGGGL